MAVRPPCPSRTWRYTRYSATLNWSGTLTTGAAAWRSIVVAIRPVYGELALPASSADLRHVAAIAADGLTTLLPRLPGFRRRELVGRPLLMGRPSALSGDFPLALVAHPSEAAAGARRTPRAARPSRRLRRPARRRCPRFRRFRLARPRPDRWLLRAGSLGLGLALLAANLVHRAGRDFHSASTVPPGFLRALFDYFVLPLSLRTGTPWHRTLPSLLLIISTCNLILLLYHIR